MSEQDESFKSSHENVMPRVNGKSFRCEKDDQGHPCGCNVFHRGLKPNSYICNACGSQYIGEPA